MRRVLSAAFACLLAFCGLPLAAQQMLVLAGSNDDPNVLINAVYTPPSTMTFGTEVASGGTTGGTTSSLTFNEVRIHAGSGSTCSLAAQTNSSSSNVSIYRLDSAGTPTLVTGSPFAVGSFVRALDWAPDGGALYVEHGAAVKTFSVACTPGNPAVAVVDLGDITVTNLNFPSDMQVIGGGVGTYLCLAAGSVRFGCSPINGGTRLPSVTPTNTLTLTNVLGLRIAPGGCGLAAGDTVAGFSVNLGTGFLTATTAPTSLPGGGWPSINQAGTLAASPANASKASLFTVDGTCTLTNVDTYTAANGVLSYLDFGADGKVYIAESERNRISVFSPTGAGFGSALIVATTNHATLNPPGGIAVATLSTVPVGLSRFTAD